MLIQTEHYNERSDQMSDVNKTILTLVHELESRYGSLKATPISSVKLKHLQDYIKSLPVKSPRDEQFKPFTIQDIQDALDRGEKKTDIAEQFYLNREFIVKNITEGRLSDRKWQWFKQHREHRQIKIKSIREAKETGL